MSDKSGQQKNDSGPQTVAGKMQYFIFILNVRPQSEQIKASGWSSFDWFCAPYLQ